MTITNLCIDFSPEAPCKNILNILLKQLEVSCSDHFIDQVIAYKPDPNLKTWWVTLREGDNCLGMATLYLPPKSSRLMPPGFIGNFIVDTTFRRSGLGSYLLKEMQTFSRRRKVTQLALVYTSDSLSFWKKKGFEENSAFPRLLFKTIWDPICFEIGTVFFETTLYKFLFCRFSPHNRRWAIRHKFPKPMIFQVKCESHIIDWNEQCIKVANFLRFFLGCNLPIYEGRKHLSMALTFFRTTNHPCWAFGNTVGLS